MPDTSNTSNASTFLFSNWSPPPGTFFQGYTFLGADYIFGEAGAHDWSSQSGRQVPGGQDGCYVTVNEVSPGAWKFEADGAGFKKLLHYHDGTNWIVSDSLERIIQHMRANSLAVKPNYPHLDSVRRGSSALLQLASRETAVQGVLLAPVGDVVMAAGGKTYQLGRHTQQDNKQSGAVTYAESLSNSTERWLRRLETVLADERMQLSLELTGGLDSRVIFGFYLRARARLGNGKVQAAPQLRCHKVKNDPRDLEVAEMLSSAYGLELNDSRRFTRVKLTGREKYALWRSQCLGTYHPVYFPHSRPVGNVVGLTGGGGGNQRPVYEKQFKTSDPTIFAARLTEKLRHKHHRPEFYNALINSVEGSHDGSDWLREHYRQFRGRLHAGRPTLQSVKFAPLGSGLMDEARLTGGHGRMSRGQLNYDLMATTMPDLLDFDFDEPKKKPSKEVRDAITTAKLSPHASPGKCWLDTSAVEETLRGERGPLENADNQYECMAQDLSRAIKDPFVQDFVGDDVISAAAAVAEYARKNGRFFHASDAASISSVLTAQLVSPNGY